MHAIYYQSWDLSQPFEGKVEDGWWRVISIQNRKLLTKEELKTKGSPNKEAEG